MAMATSQSHPRADVELASVVRSGSSAMTSESNPDGYQGLSVYIGMSPENAVFHGFRALRAECLLYQQAEIVHLERELRELQGHDRAGEVDPSLYHRDWARLRASRGASGHEDYRDQLTKIEELQHKLKEYDESLLRYRKIAKLPHPHHHTLKHMYSWMRPKDGDNVRIISHDGDAYEEGKVAAFVSLADTCEDAFTSWAQNHLIRLYHGLFGKHFHKPGTEDKFLGTVWYHNEAISRLTRGVSIAVACALPTASIFALYYVHQTQARLGLISAFTVLFALCISLASSAKTHDIFTASATFAAVLVVFVGTSDGSQA